MADVPTLIRPAGRDDVHFILSSWLKSFDRYAFAFPSMAHCDCKHCGRRNAHTPREQPRRPVPKEAYYEGQEALAKHILADSTTQVLVAVNPDDLDQIFGWACATKQSPPVLHYVYVKSFAREKGIATALLKDLGITKERKATYTHRTYASKYLDAFTRFYNPYLAYGVMTRGRKTDDEEARQASA